VTDEAEEKGFVDKAKEAAAGLAEKAKPAIGKAGETASGMAEKARPALDKAGKTAGGLFDRAKGLFKKGEGGGHDEVGTESGGDGDDGGDAASP
jgi:hypothetical protein